MFYTSREKGGARYATVGFNAGAALDGGATWPVSFALLEWTPEDEARLEALIARAAG